MRSEGDEDENPMFIRIVQMLGVEECIAMCGKPSTNQGQEGRTSQSGPHSMAGGPRRQQDHRSCCISRTG